MSIQKYARKTQHTKKIAKKIILMVNNSGMMDVQIIMASFASNFRSQFQTVTTLKSADCQSFDMNIHNFIE